MTGVESLWKNKKYYAIFKHFYSNTHNYLFSYYLHKLLLFNINNKHYILCLMDSLSSSESDDDDDEIIKYILQEVSIV